MNRVHLVGRLGRDPETRYTNNGKKVTNLLLATNYRKAGKEETIWWNIVLWGEEWDNFLPHLTKGKPLMVGGVMHKPETYVDKNGNTQVGSIDVNADYIEFVPFGKSQDEGTQQGTSSYQKQTQEPARGMVGSTVGASQDFNQDSSDEEPLPF